MKKLSTVILLFIPCILFCQIELSDEFKQALNNLINEANNRHLIEYCNSLDSANIIDESALYSHTKVYSNQLIESRSYEPGEITTKELYYKMTFDAFRLCPSVRGLIGNVFDISDHVTEFITNFETGKLTEDQFVNKQIYLMTIEIQEDANLIANEVLSDLETLKSNPSKIYTYSYYKFYPPGRESNEDLFSEENRIATLKFRIIKNKVAKVIWDDETTLFPILKRNLLNPPPPPPPPNRNK